LLFTPQTEGMGGYIGITLSVHQSVCPNVSVSTTPPKCINWYWWIFKQL